jgi:hypothetical protein
METIKRKTHGEGQKISPNMHRVTVYLYNPVRKDSSTGKGSKDFKTTHTFNEVKTFEEAFGIINQFAEGGRDGHMNYSRIKKAYYNGKPIISDGIYIAKNNLKSK